MISRKGLARSVVEPLIAWKKMHGVSLPQLASLSVVFLTFVPIALAQSTGAISDTDHTTLQAQVKTSKISVACANKTSFSLGNEWLEASGSTQSGHWNGLRIVDRATQRSIELPEAFCLRLKNQSTLRSTRMELTQAFVVQNLLPNPNASRYAEHLGGKEVCAKFSDQKTSVYVEWCGILRENSNYFRQQITIHASAAPLPITEICLLQFNDRNAQVVGRVMGSPIADSTMFFGFEHPLSISQVNYGIVRASLPRVLPIQSGHTISYSSVVGVAPAGQLRRSFLRYVERERAHPYRPFLQYNSWGDLGFSTSYDGLGTRYDEGGVLNRIHAFGSELVAKSGATISSFVLDDGWDNLNSLWGFNSGFPDGFGRISKEASQYHSYIGAWLSPQGGYNEAKQVRVKFGRKQGYEIVNGDFALSGPKYYLQFETICLNMIHNYGVNEFKFDGIGFVNHVFPGSSFDSDSDAMISLIHSLRKTEPDIFIDLSTGALPSPFWLLYVDSIGREGDDENFAGVGSFRQRWITYRDAQLYKTIQDGPLFPLNSLMGNGLIYARLVKDFSGDSKDFHDEIESFFGLGSQIQDMGVTPSLLSQGDWDTLAQGANWARRNSETLKDTHWVGGDPERLQVYGWASWSPRKAIIILRNPSDKPQIFSLDIRTAMELPVDAPQNYVAHDPWDDAASAATVQLHAGQPIQITLKPWEVRTLDAKPLPR